MCPHLNSIKFELLEIQTGRVPFVSICLEQNCRYKNKCGGKHAPKMQHRLETHCTTKGETRRPTTGSAEPLVRPNPEVAHLASTFSCWLVCISFLRTSLFPIKVAYLLFLAFSLVLVSQHFYREHMLTK
jgi:hypothetical protein